MHAEAIFGRLACMSGRGDQAWRDTGGGCPAIRREPRLRFALSAGWTAHTVPISILSSSSLLSLKPSSASQPLLLLGVPPTPSRAYARLSLLALMKSLVLNVLPISLTQDINLNGKCSRCLHPHWKSLFLSRFHL